MIERIFCHPIHLERLLAIKAKVYKAVGTLIVEGSKSSEPIPLKDRDKLNFVSMKKGENWGGKFDCCWFHIKGQIPLSSKGKHVVALLNFNGEGAIYDGGKVIQGLTQVLSGIDAVQTRMGKQIVDLTKEAVGGEIIDYYIDCGNNGINGMFLTKAKIKNTVIAEVIDYAYRYFYDYMELFLLILSHKDNKLLSKERKEEMESVLNESYRLFSAKEYEKAEVLITSAYDKKKDYKATVYTAIGHAHLDLAWLWPIRESKRKAIRTFSNAINNFDKYPEYIFGASQAQMFDWVKKDQTELYDRIKENVKLGKIEVQGNMWTECDCNLPSGESLIRQFLYGDKFFIGEMGIRSRMVWLPDVFGFPASMPQIIKGVGKDYFMTIKLSWNKYNRFPHQTFSWVGADGSEIIAHIAPEGNYNSNATPLSIANANKKYYDNESGKALLIYGVGDGGGGPGEGHLELLERDKKLYGINEIKQASAESFFDELSQLDLKKYQGELYLEKHQGTYTSQAANKLYNRLMERALHNVEWLQAVTGNNVNIDDIWKETLLYQFHDIIPGSSINRVYKESIEGYKNMYRKLSELENAILNDLTMNVGLAVVNPTSFYRKENIKHNDTWYKAECEPYATGKLSFIVDGGASRCGKTFIENQYLKVIFNKKGVLVSVFDKIKKLEYAKEGLNKLVVYNDPKMYYDAWDIKDNYVNKMPKEVKLVSAKSYIDGPNVVMEQQFIFNKSTINQRVILNEDMIKFDIKASWHESHKMLRANFAPTIFSDKVNCDIQFCSIDRSTKNDTTVEKAQFEICAQKYVAVNDDNGYFALINDCKYGHRVKDGIISLNLLRSPKYPDKDCDMGAHSFGYAIKVFDSIRDVTQAAYVFNNPLILVEKDVKINPIVSVDNENVIIETIKRAEDGEGIVIRMYERYGNTEKVSLTVNISNKGLFECNLLEENRQEIDSVITLTPHQIKTIYIRK